MNRYAVPLPFSLRINKKTLVLFTVALLLIFIAGFRPIGLDRDSPNYVSLLNIPFSQANFLDKEPAFWMLVEINRVLFSSNERTFFLIFAIIGVSLKILAINRLSSMPFLSLLAYICLYFILHEMTQIRAGVASGIFLLAIQDIVNRNFKKFIIKVLFASLFHYSAIIMVPLYFLNPRKISIIYFLLPITGLLFAYFNFNLSKILLANFVGILPEFLAYKVRMYLSLLELGVHSEINILNIHYSFLLIVLYFGLFCGVTNRLKSPYDILFVKILSIMLFTFYFFSPVPVFAFRISEFLGVILIILIPHLLLTFKQKSIVLLPIIVWLITYFCVIQVGRILNL